MAEAGPASARQARKQMGRKGVAFPKGLRGTGDGPSVKILFHPQWPLGVRGTALAATVLALLGVVAFGVTREVTTTGRTPSPALSRPAATPPKPAFTRAEEVYIQALWPIHGEVERSTVRVSLGKIFYKINELGKADLKTKVDAALATYRRAEERISALQPPSSFARAHDEYLAAVRLFQQAALEVLKMFDDGNDEHLLAAYPLSQEGSDKIREIGAKFWEDEFPPH
jgi:hypothetical protein